jgi:two-component system nitrogen regulation response regulator GlnG/two-component system response regulator HydG
VNTQQGGKMRVAMAGIPEDDWTTQEEGHAEHSTGDLPEPAPVTAFVIAWYPHDPNRVGELAVIPSPEGRLVLGRGLSEGKCVRFFRPRPGLLEPAAPLTSPALSRHQLDVTIAGGAISVRRVGKCPLRINGVEQDEGVIVPGHTLSFGQELLLLCLQRPAFPARPRHWPAARDWAFGEADSFGMVGESPAIWRLRDELAFAANSGQHVLLIGESGTGKELAARALHQLSSRTAAPFVTRNAATLPAGLMDAEMFGNVKNYPNPGMPERPGLVGQAHGGFLFLDEVSQLSTELQAHLLRVLDQHGEYQRLGEAVVRHSSFRLIAATNRDPEELRPDFLARFPVRIELPPLWERREDIPLMVRHSLRRAAEKNPELNARFGAGARSGAARDEIKVDTLLIDALLRRRSRTNGRDIEVLLWKAIAASRDAVLRLDSATIRAAQPVEPEAVAQPRANSTTRQRNREPTAEEVRAVLQREHGNVTRAAKELGLSSRYALHRILRRLGIERPDEIS